jgi:predicted component of type VI protein secretion system
MNGSVKLTIPPSMRPVIEALGKNSIPAIRAAIKVCMSPARAHMKALVNTETMASKQSTGATYRAVTSKSGQSRSNRNVFYAIVGISRRVTEEHYSPSHPASAGKQTKKKQGLATGRGLYALRAITTFNRRHPSRTKIRTKQVFSRLRTSPVLGKRNRARGFLRRTPNKYFHLIENGFTHFSGVQSKAYRFVSRTMQATGEQCISIFKSRLKISITEAVIKSMNRMQRDSTQS